MKFFRRNRASINSVSIPSFGWPLDQENKGVKQWINPEQTMAISVIFFDSEPDIPTLKMLDQLRGFYRDQIVQQNGGLIQVDVLNVKGYESVKTIFKIPQDPVGMTYLASLTIPFRKFSFVIKIQAPEIGMTGVRDSVIAANLLNQDVISIGESGYVGWFRDPYSSESTEGTRMNKSEEEIYDAEFPAHPLTKVRELMRQIEKELKFGSELEKARRFK